MRGSHFIKGWCKTQQCVTLSSAEAELVAMTKTAAELFGIISMLVDLGEASTSSYRPDSGSAVGSTAGPVGHLVGVLCGDSSAAIAVSQRRGCGKLRHIHIGQLWIQEKVLNNEVTVKKVLGEENPADLTTKHANEVKCQKYCTSMSMRLKEGRAKVGLKVQQGASKGYDAQVV